MQQFVIPKGGYCWDLSSDIFIERVKQVGGTFIGGLVGHTTLQSIWEVVLDGYVTTLCPGDGYILAWGSNLRRKKKKNLNM